MKPNKEVIKAARVVSAVFDVPLKEIMSKSRQSAIPRQAALYVARAKTPCSNNIISLSLGYADHSTFNHAMRAVVERRQNDPHFNRRINQCLKKYGRGSRAVEKRETGREKMLRERSVRRIVKAPRLVDTQGYEHVGHYAYREKLYAGRTY